MIYLFIFLMAYGVADDGVIVPGPTSQILNYIFPDMKGVSNCYFRRLYLDNRVV